MSQFSIDQFKASLINGGARANYFLVRGNFPGSGQGFVNAAASAAGALFGSAAASTVTSATAAVGGGNPSSQIQFLCRAAAIPAFTVGTVEVGAPGGRLLKLAGDREFAEWTISIYNDNTFGLRNEFERWSNLLNAVRSNVGPDDPNSYFQDWSVTQLTRTGTPIKTYNFRGCWPSQVAEIALDFDAKTEIETFDVTLQYQYYETDDNTTS